MPVLEGPSTQLSTSPRSAGTPPNLADHATKWPRVDVVVAYRNEKGLMAKKVRNLRGLDYPHQRIRFLMIDGASEDRSESIGRAAAAGDPRFRWLRCERAGKTRQINLGLSRSDAPWLLLTDADARLPRDAIRRLISRGESDPAIGLVGTECHPRRAFGMDRTHWEVWNAVRRLEHRSGCVTALGPCYLLRRDAFGGWPDDVVADDVYASLEVSRIGLRSVLADVLVIERRAPAGFGGFLWHKVRKVRAVLVELLRFLPGANEFRAAPRIAFLCKALAIFAGPVLALACCVVLAILFPLASALGAVLIALSFAFPPRARIARRASGPLRAVGLVLTLSLVLVAAMVTLPLARPRAIFCRWKLEES